MNCTEKSKKICLRASVNVEGYEFDGEHALRDVLRDILKYLSYQDLDRVSKVCRSWRDEVLREEARRLIYIQQLHLSYNFGNLDSLLKLKPICASVLFFDDATLNDCRALAESMKGLSHKSIALNVPECITSEEVDFDFAKGHGKVRGLFFPDVEPRADVYVAYSLALDYTSCNNQKDIDEAADDLAEELRLNEYPKCTLLVFINLLARGGTKIAKMLKERIQNSWTEVMMISCSLMFKNFENEDSQLLGRDECLAAVNIAGSNVDSWTTEISLFLSIEGFEQKLLELKQRLKPRRHCTGLIYGYVCEDRKCSHIKHPTADKRELMRILKRFFPSIPFLGAFNTKWNFEEYRRLIGWAPEREPKRLSLIIISYN